MLLQKLDKHNKHAQAQHSKSISRNHIAHPMHLQIKPAESNGSNQQQVHQNKNPFSQACFKLIFKQIQQQPKKNHSKGGMPAWKSIASSLNQAVPRTHPCN